MQELIIINLYLNYYVNELQTERMDEFFAANGLKCLLFYYEETTTMEGGKRVSEPRQRALFLIVMLVIYGTWYFTCS